jgi:endonuclease YncB( thermonuclease family)
MRLLLALCLIVTLTPGHVRRVIDGDTFVLHHVGVPAEERVRILGVDTPERFEVGATAATAFTAMWLARGDFTLHACRRDSFGRLLGTVTRGTDSLHVAIIAAGHGVRAP